MKRRTFIQQLGIVAGAAAISPNLAFTKPKEKRLVILHTNDTHSNMDPFPANHSKYPNMGGVSRRSKLIQSIRSTNEHVLLLDAGDIFQGTPYFNKFKGEVEMKAMEAMQYEIATLGNHDFDIGMDGYLNAKKHANFQVVNANYSLENTPLASIVKPHVVMMKGGLKIGVFGVGVDLNGLVNESNFKGLRYNDPISVAQQQVEELRKKGCDLIICLSHLGYEYADTTKVSDKRLAAETEGIDIIIGGHTHTFLNTPTVVNNKLGKQTLISQVGYGGLQLGKIDVVFSKKKLNTTVTTASIDQSLDKI